MKNTIFTIFLLFSVIFNTAIVAQEKHKKETFTTFFNSFNKDKSFQMSRVQFPLIVKLNNDDFELVDYTITKEKHTIINLNRDIAERDYNQKTILKKDRAVIQQRGINNGIFIDYIFEKRKGLWFLKTWIDMST